MEFPSVAQLYPPADQMLDRLMRAERKHRGGLIPSRPRRETDIVGHVVDGVRAEVSYEGKRPIGDAHDALLDRSSYTAMSPNSKRATLSLFGREIEIFDPLYLLIPLAALVRAGPIQLLDLYSGWGERIISVLVEPRIFHYSGYHTKSEVINAFNAASTPSCLKPDSRISLHEDRPPLLLSHSNVVVFAPPFHGYDVLEESLSRQEWEDEIMAMLDVGINALTTDGVVLTYLREYIGEVNGEHYDNVSLVGLRCHRRGLHLVSTFHCGEDGLVCLAWKR